MGSLKDFDEDALKALLSDEIRAAKNEDRSDLQQRRERAIDYYNGTMTDTPAKENRSSVVSMDLSTTIGWMLPGIIRVFTASDQMAIYEPMKPEDEEFAAQATDYVNYVFMKDNPGYRTLWDATHDALLMGNGIVKHYWDDAEECEYSEHSGLTEEQIAMMLQEEGVEVVSHSEGAPQMVMVPDEQGQMIEQPIPTMNVKIKRVLLNGRPRVECIEPEDFYIDRQATRIEEARFTAHRREVTRSELIEMGFDKDIVDNLSPFQVSTNDGVDLAREEESVSRNAVGHESMQTVELFECYVKADSDGDGIAETIRAYYAGDGGNGDLLDWEVWDDDIPFSDIPCEPVPHRWDARSISDEIIDVQRVKTVMTRGLMDNIYWTNEPMMQGEADSIVNMELLKNPKFGGTLLRKAGRPPIEPLAVPFIGDKMLLGLQHWDEIAEKRTGVSRSMMALDPEALQNQTATANQNQRDAAYSQVELIARNMAELGWRRVFKCLLKLIIKHQDRPRTIRLRDKWVDMDPRHWNAGMDVAINVGLGTGSRDRDMSMLNTIFAMQVAMADRFAAGGMIEHAIKMIPKIVETAKKIAESAGLKNPEVYYPEFDDETLNRALQEAAQRAEQPDPKIQIEQQKLQMEGEKAKFQAQLEVQKMQQQGQMDASKTQMEHDAKMQQLAAEMDLKVRQIDAEMSLKREQLVAELQLKRELAYAEMEMKKELGVFTASVKESGGTSPVRPGGEPG